mgnify:CR=1 FL=1
MKNKLNKIVVNFYNYVFLPFVIFLFAYNLHRADDSIKYFATQICYTILGYFLYSIIKLIMINLLSYKTVIVIYKDTYNIKLVIAKLEDSNLANIKKIMRFEWIDFLSKSQVRNKKEDIIKNCKNILESENAELVAIILDDEMFYKS